MDKIYTSIKGIKFKNSLLIYSRIKYSTTTTRTYWMSVTNSCNIFGRCSVFHREDGFVDHLTSCTTHDVCSEDLVGIFVAQNLHQTIGVSCEDVKRNNVVRNDQSKNGKNMFERFKQKKLEVENSDKKLRLYIVFMSELVDFSYF